MRTLIGGTEEEIAREVSNAISVLRENGGYILGTSQGYLPEIPAKNIEMMYRKAILH